jgi:hypothetical protein
VNGLVEPAVLRAMEGNVACAASLLAMVSRKGPLVSSRAQREPRFLLSVQVYVERSVKPPLALSQE